jgi:hypothetical protein
MGMSTQALAAPAGFPLMLPALIVLAGQPQRIGALGHKGASITRRQGEPNGSNHIPTNWRFAQANRTRTSGASHYSDGLAASPSISNSRSRGSEERRITPE